MQPQDFFDFSHADLLALLTLLPISYGVTPKMDSAIFGTPRVGEAEFAPVNLRGFTLIREKA